MIVVTFYMNNFTRLRDSFVLNNHENPPASAEEQSLKFSI